MSPEHISVIPLMAKIVFPQEPIINDTEITIARNTKTDKKGTEMIHENRFWIKIPDIEHNHGYLSCI